jgi:ATP-binding cassette subfamily C protein
MSCREAFVGIGLFSAIINVLALTGSLFMLEIYDRVLPSRSVPTLVGLAVLAGLLLSVQTVLDVIRVRVLVRIGASLDQALSRRVYAAVVRLPLKAGDRGEGLQPMRDLDTVRSFLSSLGPTALCDLPWIPIYLGIVYALHPLLGTVALAGALLLLVLTLLTELLGEDRHELRHLAPWAGRDEPAQCRGTGCHGNGGSDGRALGRSQ